LENQLLNPNSDKENNKITIKRPIIFICNDPYSKGLRELRKKAIIFNFRKSPSDKFHKRLNDICVSEGLAINSDMLKKICEQNEYDIRSCLNQLELIAKTVKKRGRITRDEYSDPSYLMNLSKEFNKGVMSVLDDVIQKPKEGLTKSSTSSRDRK
jgi:chromosome transmission fidelity protein 18